jgi:hypothetical protein
MLIVFSLTPLIGFMFSENSISMAAVRLVLFLETVFDSHMPGTFTLIDYFLYQFVISYRQNLTPNL